MYKLAHIIHAFIGKRARLAVMVLTIALFVISAAAPNATIGIGK